MRWLAVRCARLRKRPSVALLVGSAVCSGAFNLAGLSVAASAAEMAGCAKQSVSAQGEAASFQWLARIKAIGNWRSKVRHLPELGAAYDDWRKGKEPLERCINNSGSIICTVTATPCRS